MRTNRLTQGWVGLLAVLLGVAGALPAADPATLPGIGEYADIYRGLNLPAAERAAIEQIYNAGAVGEEATGFLQTLGGGIVNDSLLALRYNLVNTRRHILRRLTSFQYEELEERSPSISASHYPSLISRSGHGNDYSGIWAYIDQTWMDQDDTGNVAGYKYAPHGLGVGYERHDDAWIFGGLLRYDGGAVKLKSRSATRTEVDSLTLSGYLSWARDGYYASGALQAGFGWNKSTSDFSLAGLPSSVAHGEFLTDVFGISGEFGYMLDIVRPGGGGLRVTPYGSLAYARLGREVFTETGGGSFNRNFSGTAWHLGELGLGLRLSAPVVRDRYTLLPFLDAAFLHSIGSPGGGSRDVTLLAHPDASWGSDVMDDNRFAVTLTGGLAARFQSGLTLGAEVELEFRKKGLATQASLNMSKGF